MKYEIGAFSEKTGVSIHTLRYYEKERLICPARKDNGRRIYCDDDVAWILFIKRLKDTGMSIKEIQKYALLRAQGDDTMPERMEMMSQHRVLIQKELVKWQEHLEKLDAKIAFYETAIAKTDRGKSF